MKDVLVDYEQFVLRALQFALEVELPYIYIVHYAKTLFSKDLKQQALLLQVAWTLCNDSFRTTVCIRYKATEVAISCIYLGMFKIAVVLKDSGCHCQDWTSILQSRTTMLVSRARYEGARIRMFVVLWFYNILYSLVTRNCRLLFGVGQASGGPAWVKLQYFI